MSISILHGEPVTGDQPAPRKRHTTSLSTKILSKILVGLIMIPVAATTLLFILMSLSLSLFFFSLYWFLHRNYRHRRESSDGLSSPRRCVKSLSQFRFYEPVRYGSECVVCIDGFRQGQWCRKLPGCGHVFHRKCVDFWLVKVATCPVCRDRVLL